MALQPKHVTNKVKLVLLESLLSSLRLILKIVSRQRASFIKVGVAHVPY